jgi:hypothetical protein
VILRRIGAALDPSGTLLPSWANGIQPCLPTFGSGQKSTSPGYGQTWAGVAGYCLDGAFVGHPWGAGGNPAGARGNTGGWGWGYGAHDPRFSIGGIGALVLTGLGLDGTLPVDLRLLRTLTILDLSQNRLTGSIPAAWGLPVTWTNYVAQTITTGPAKIVNTTRGAALGLLQIIRIDLGRNLLSGTLPPELGNYDSGLQLSIIDNNISGTVPASYANWDPTMNFYYGTDVSNGGGQIFAPVSGIATLPSWLAASYNPLLYGAWPAGLGSTAYNPIIGSSDWDATKLSRAEGALMGYMPSDPYRCSAATYANYQYNYGGNGNGTASLGGTFGFGSFGQTDGAGGYKAAGMVQQRGSGARHRNEYRACSRASRL